ncbi:MAG: class I SAM-dependent methyltransferase [Acetobacter cibinongensis]
MIGRAMNDVMPSMVPGFYRTHTGATCAALLRERLQWFWPDLRQQKILGIGYATPCLEAWRGRGALCVSALQPDYVLDGERGELPHQDYENILCADPALLPFQDDTFDRIVLLHAFRDEAHAMTVLRGASRVLRDDGRMLFITPSQWCGRLRQRRTPFAREPAFGARALGRIFDQTMLHTERRDEVLFLPAQWGCRSLQFGQVTDIAGKVLAPGLGSLSLIEVVKNSYSMLSMPVQARRRVWRKRFASVPEGCGKVPPPQS